MDRNYECQINCSKETKKLLTEDCIEEYLSYHPEMRGINITQGFILRKVIEHYLKWGYNMFDCYSAEEVNNICINQFNTYIKSDILFILVTGVICMALSYGLILFYQKFSHYKNINLIIFILNITGYISLTVSFLYLKFMI